MNRIFINKSTGGIAVVLMALLSLPVFGKTINVTMKLNTATNRDTLSPSDVVQIRGEATAATVPAVTWDDKTGLVLQNKGGDYWETTFQMNSGETLKYKFWTGFTTTAGTFFWGGWEGPINPANPVNSGDNRLFIAGENDTTLALQFYHGTDVKKDQYWRPYESKPDTFALFLKVNMAALMETHDFVAGTDGPVVARGGFPMDPTNTWNTLITLQREEGSIANGSFFSGAAYIAKSSVKAGDGQQFKFVYTKSGSAVWESVSNRWFSYPGATDTTIHWAYFNNQKPTGGNIVEAVLTWQIKTGGLEKLGLFNRSIGDKIVIDGAKAWDVANAIEMTYVPLLKLWMGQETFIKAPGAVLEYKPVIIWDASRVDPTSPNYIPGKETDTDSLRYWEEPAVTGTGNRNYTYTNQTAQAIPGDYGFDFQFFNGLPEEGVIETPITVTFSVNMAPAADIATNPSNPLFRPGVDSVWVKFIDCLLPLTQGEGIYTNTALLLTDPNGDMVYTGSKTLVPPTTYDAAYRINYSTETGAIIQNGGGFTSGRSYYQYVHPTAVLANGTITWPSEFTFPTVPWAGSDLTVEDPPDLFTPTAVESGNTTRVSTFLLDQNYPNPFNPETTIEYQLGKQEHVRINVYNLTGQLVSTLVDAMQAAGRHDVRWNGKNQTGNEASSGIYFVKMISGSFEHVRKITLLR